MTVQATLAFAAAFVLLAASPGPGLAAILSRALGGGMASGYAVMAGLVFGDAVFLAAAMIGLSAIASALGPLFQVVKLAGAAYLIWLGVQTWRTAAKTVAVEAQSSRALVKDVMLGLMVTLGNPKPILFYGALLPTFLDLQTVTVGDFAVLMAVVVAVSTVVYGVYMAMAARARTLLASSGAAKRLNQATGAMMIGAGVAVASR